MTDVQLRIDHLYLEDVGGFREMNVAFGPRLNVVCGPNGVGKTTLLDAIAAVFISSYSMGYLRRRAGSDLGTIEYAATLKDKIYEGRGTVSNFRPGEQSSPFGTDQYAAQNLIYVKSGRDFEYNRLDGVMRDPELNGNEHQVFLINGISVSNIKQWFGNRYLMAPHGDHWPEHQHSNLELAKTFFSLLDDRVKLSHVDSSTFEIILQTPSGDIPFEYMSAGFRTSYGLFFGILKEIEFRRLNVSARDFNGIIMVDELDLHLHPTWHGPILRSLQAAYSKAQIIVTTHSPHMIQHTSAENLIILPKDGGEPVKLKGVDPEFGLIGWTVEEILRDVMGMDDPRPPEFVQMMEAYENAVTRKKETEIQVAKAKVLKALHPSSVVRQIIEIESL